MRLTRIPFIVALGIAVAGITAAPGAAGQQRYAQPNIPVCHMRGAPGHARELVSQSLLGTPLRVMSSNAGWSRVESPEGYQGFVKSNSLTFLSAGQLKAWQESERVIISAYDITYAYDTPEGIGRADRVTSLLPGNIVTVLETNGDKGIMLIATPDGREGWVRMADTTPLDEWFTQKFDPADLTADARKYMGLQYLWGGTTAEGADCSGFTQMLAYRRGVLLPRDASQQVKVGRPVYTKTAAEKLDAKAVAQFKPGDLIFFNTSGGQNVNHVGYYAGNGDVIHCSGRVRVNSLIPGETGYDQSLNILQVNRLTPDDIDRLKKRIIQLYGLGHAAAKQHNSK